MVTIALVNMPSSPATVPASALTQLKGAITRRFPGRAGVDIRNVNRDFARFVGLDLYQALMYGDSTIGDWFFQRAAFPECPDDDDACLPKCQVVSSDEAEVFRYAIAEKRGDLDGFLDHLVQTYRLDQADIVGFTSMCTQSMGSLALARRVRAGNPEVVTALGGANCEEPARRALAADASAIDYFFPSQALTSFPDFVGYWLAGAREECERIPGVLCRPHGSVRGNASICSPLPSSTCRRRR